MTVTVDGQVLDAVAPELADVAGTLPDLLARARSLDAGWAVAGLGDVTGWAQDTVVDLRARIGLIRMMEDQAVTGLVAPGGFGWLDVLGARTPVVGTLMTLQPLPGTGSGWARRPNESLDDWVTRLEGQAIDRLPLLEGHGDQIAEGLSWWNDYVSLMVAGGMSSTAVTTIGKTQLARALLPKVEELVLQGRLPVRAVEMLKPFTSYKAPGTTMQSLLMKVLPFDRLDRVPLPVSRWAANSGLRQLLPRVEGGLPAAGRTAIHTLFGTEWTSAAGEVLPRGASNLIRVGQEARWGTKLATVGRTAGVLRGAGVVGGVLSTGYDVADLISQGNPVAAFRRDKAGYIADLSRTAFDASLTAALIAPNPITWGAVAVTGVIYAGVEVVEHWDDITKATGEAADWAGDRLDDVGGAIGDGVQAIKESPVNPMNWF